MYGSQAWKLLVFNTSRVLCARVGLLCYFLLMFWQAATNQNDCSVYCLVCKEKCGC